MLKKIKNKDVIEKILSSITVVLVLNMIFFGSVDLVIASDGLEIDVDSEHEYGELVEIEVSGSSNLAFQFEIVDASGETVYDTYSFTDADGDYDTSFYPNESDEYTVRVSDDQVFDTQTFEVGEPENISPQQDTPDSDPQLTDESSEKRETEEEEDASRQDYVTETTTDQAELIESDDIITLQDDDFTVTEDMYLRGDRHTVNNFENTYILNGSQSDSDEDYTFTSDDYVDATVEWGVRFWTVDEEGNEEEVTGGTPVAVVSRDDEDEGIQQETYNFPEVDTSEDEALLSRVYMRIGGEDWDRVVAEHITEPLGARKILDSEVTVRYYTGRDVDYQWGSIAQNTIGEFYWGDSTYDSGIENLQYEASRVKVNQTLPEGDLNTYPNDVFTHEANVTCVAGDSCGDVVLVPEVCEGDDCDEEDFEPVAEADVGLEWSEEYIVIEDMPGGYSPKESINVDVLDDSEYSIRFSAESEMVVDDTTEDTFVNSHTSGVEFIDLDHQNSEEVDLDIYESSDTIDFVEATVEAQGGRAFEVETELEILDEDMIPVGWFGGDTYYCGEIGQGENCTAEFSDIEIPKGVDPGEYNFRVNYEWANEGHYVYDIDPDDEGSVPEGWERSSDYMYFEVQTDADDEPYIYTGSWVDREVHGAWTEVGEHDDMEVLAKVYPEQSVDASVGVRMDPDNSVGYGGGQLDGSSKIKRQDSFTSSTTLESDDSVFADGEEFWIRMNVEGDEITVKGWAEGDKEPDFEDAPIALQTTNPELTSGFPGLYSSGGDNFRTYYYSVGLEGAETSEAHSFEVVNNYETFESDLKDSSLLKGEDTEYSFELENKWPEEIEDVEIEINCDEGEIDCSAVSHYALDFDGDNDYIEIGDADFETDELTLSTWAKRSETDFDPLISWGDWNEGVTYYFRDDESEISVNAGIGGRDEVSYEEDSIGVWNHVVLTICTETGEARVYLNGEDLGTVDSQEDGEELPLDGTLRIGRYDGESFGGLLDDVRIYDKVLSESEIDDLYGERYRDDVASEDLAGWWPMNEGDGDIVEDESGDSDGDIVGASWEPMYGGNMAPGETREVNFDIITDDDTASGDYDIDVNVTYENPNEEKVWEEVGEEQLSVYDEGSLVTEILDVSGNPYQAEYKSEINYEADVNESFGPLNASDPIDEGVDEYEHWIYGTLSGSQGEDLNVYREDEESGGWNETYITDDDLNEYCVFQTLPENYTYCPSIDERFEAYWTLDEEGQMAWDHIGEHHGELYGDPEQGVDAPVGQGYEFDGDGDFVYIEEDDDLDVNEFTISGWFQVDEDADGLNTIISKQGSDAWYDRNFWITIDLDDSEEGDGSVWARTSSGGDPAEVDIRSSGGFHDGDWHHFSFVHDTTEDVSELYVNGELEGADGASAPDGQGEPTAIGANIDGSPDDTERYFEGQISDVSLYSRPMEEDEVQEIYEPSSTVEPSEEELLEFPDDITRGEDIELRGLVENTGDDASDVYLNWSLPDGWDADEVSRYWDTLDADEVKYNNITSDVTVTADTGTNVIEIISEEGTGQRGTTSTKDIDVYAPVELDFTEFPDNAAYGEVVEAEITATDDAGSFVENQEIVLVNYNTGETIGRSSTDSSGQVSFSFEIDDDWDAGGNEIVALKDQNDTAYTRGAEEREVLYVNSYPQITDVDAEPDEFGFGYGTTINATVEDVDGVDEVYVNLEKPSGDEEEYEMELGEFGEDYYLFDYDNAWETGTYEYSVTAYDVDGYSSTITGRTFEVKGNVGMSVVTEKDEYGPYEDVVLERDDTVSTYLDSDYKSLTMEVYADTLYSNDFDVFVGDTSGDHTNTHEEDGNTFDMEQAESGVLPTETEFEGVFTYQTDFETLQSIEMDSVGVAEGEWNVSILNQDTDETELIFTEGGDYEYEDLEICSDGCDEYIEDNQIQFVVESFQSGFDPSVDTYSLDYQSLRVESSEGGFEKIDEPEDIEIGRYPFELKRGYTDFSLFELPHDEALEIENAELEFNVTEGDDTGELHLVEVFDEDSDPGEMHESTAPDWSTQTNPIDTFDVDGEGSYVIDVEDSLTEAIDNEQLGIAFQLRGEEDEETYYELEDSPELNVDYSADSLATNIGDEDVTGYIDMRVQRLEGNEWENFVPPVVDVTNGSFPLNVDGELNLSEIWEENGGWNTDVFVDGKYRVKTAYVDGDSDTIADEEGEKILDTHEFEILGADLEVSDIVHSNQFNYGLNEYGVGDIIEWINVTVENTEVEAADVSIDLNVVDENGENVDWGPSSVKECGDIGPDENCTRQWDDDGQGYTISDDELPETLMFHWNATIDSENAETVVNNTFRFNVHDLRSEVESNIEADYNRIYKDESTIYDFTVENPWSEQIDDVEVEINCDQEQIDCIGTESGTVTETVDNIGAGETETFSFELSTDDDTETGDYDINATLSYENPGENEKEWLDLANEVLRVREPGALIEIEDYPERVTRGYSGYEFEAFINNTHQETLDDVESQWILAEEWTNETGSLYEFTEHLDPGEIIWNNFTADISQDATLGETDIVIETDNDQDRFDEVTLNVETYADVNLELELNDTSPAVNDTLEATATLSYENGTEISHEDLEAYVDGTLIDTQTTDEDGEVVFTHDVEEPEGDRLFNVTYEGSDTIYTNPDYNNQTFTVTGTPEIEYLTEIPEADGFGSEIDIEAGLDGEEDIEDIDISIEYPDGSNVEHEMEVVEENEVYSFTFVDTWNHGTHEYTVEAINVDGNKDVMSSSFTIEVEEESSIFTETSDYDPGEEVELLDDSSYIENVGTYDFEGRIRLSVEREIDGQWETYEFVYEDDETQDIDEVYFADDWNDDPWIASEEPGNYRATFELVDPDGNVLSSGVDDIAAYHEFTVGEPPSDVDIEQIEIYDVDDAADEYDGGELVDSGLNDSFYVPAESRYRFDISVENDADADGSWNITDEDLITHTGLNESWNINPDDIFYEIQGDVEEGGEFDGTVEWDTAQGGFLEPDEQMRFSYIIDVPEGEEERDIVFEIDDSTFTVTDDSILNIIEIDDLPPEPLLFDLENTSLERGSSMQAYSKWSENIDAAEAEYNRTTAALTNVTADVVEGQWVNHTIESDEDWPLGMRSVRFYAEDFFGNWNKTWTESFALYGVSRIDEIDLDPEIIESGEETEISCRVKDDIGSPIEGYEVNISDDQLDVIDNVDTDEEGWANTTYQTDEIGDQSVYCVIDDWGEEFYEAHEDESVASDVLTVIDPEGPEYHEYGSNATRVFKTLDDNYVDFYSEWTDSTELDMAVLTDGEYELEGTGYYRDIEHESEEELFGSINATEPVDDGIDPYNHWVYGHWTGPEGETPEARYDIGDGWNDTEIFAGGQPLCVFQTLPENYTNCYEEPSGLLSFWTLDEEGQMAWDHIGEHHGELYGDPEQGVDAPVGQGYEFDGDGDFVHVENDPELDVEDFSISGWFRIEPDADDLNTIISKQGSDSDEDRNFWITVDADDSYEGDGVVWARTSVDGSTGVDIVSDPGFDDGDWHHFSFVHDSDGEAELYVNGELEGTDGADTPDGWNEPTAIGAQIDGSTDETRRYFEGGISGVRLYDRTLTGDEVEEMYVMDVELGEREVGLVDELPETAYDPLELDGTYDWANFTITPFVDTEPRNTSWNIHANDTSGNVNTTPDIDVDIWAWSVLDGDSGANRSLVEPGDGVEMACQVTEGNGSALENYDIQFYEDGTLIEDTTTDDDGWASITRTYDSEDIGDEFELSCEIDDVEGENIEAHADFDEVSDTVEVVDEIDAPQIVDDNYYLEDTEEIFIDEDTTDLVTQWDRELDTAWVEYNYSEETGFVEEAVEVEGDNWANRTFAPDSDWDAGTVAVKSMANTSDGGLNETLDHLYFDVWSRSSVNWLEPEESDVRGETTLKCEVIDHYTGEPISGYDVDFYDEDFDPIGSGTTNTDGVAEYVEDTGDLEAGEHEFECVIDDFEDKNYRTEQDSDSEAIDILGQLDTEIIDPEDGTEVHRGDQLSLDSITTDEFDDTLSPDQVEWENSTDVIGLGESDVWEVAGDVGPETITATSFKEYFVEGSDTVDIDIFGYSEILWTRPEDASRPVGTTVDLECEVSDNKTGMGIGDYDVDFYWENDTHSGFIGTNSSQIDGQAEYSWDTDGLEPDNYTTICNITDQEDLYYSASENDTVEAEVELTDEIVGEMEVEIDQPETGTLVPYERNFTLNATAECTEGECGSVDGEVRYNESGTEPDTPVSDVEGEEPFYTHQSNPMGCGDLTEGENCTVEWQINTTEGLDSNYNLDVLFEADTVQNVTDSVVVEVGKVLILDVPYKTVDWGDQDPSDGAVPAPDTPYDISLDENSNDADGIFIRGTHLTSEDDNEIDVSNIKWCHNCAGADYASNMSLDYSSIVQPAYSGSTYETDLWLDVPAAFAGTYEGEITVMANATW